MKAILLGSDFMYNQNGDLIPIQINTAIGHNMYDRIEDDDYVFDLLPLKEFIIKYNFQTIFYIGNIIPFKDRLSNLCNELGKSLSFFKLSPPSLTVPLLRDSDDVLIIRSAYDTSAIIDDSYCRDRVNFLKIIQNFNFGSEIAYINDDGILINNIKTIPQNDIYPNFILKSKFPDYDRNLYPKLIKLKTKDELDSFLKDLTISYFLMPFYFNKNKLYDNHIINIRSLNILYSPDLMSIPIGAYSKKTKYSISKYINNESYVDNRYSFLTTDDINVEDFKNEYAKKKLIKKSEINNMNFILTKIGEKIISIHS